MTRIARIVVPHAPDRVTQRGNRGERVFLESGPVGSIARSDIAGMDDALVGVQPSRNRVAILAGLLAADPDDPQFNGDRSTSRLARLSRRPQPTR